MVDYLDSFAIREASDVLTVTPLYLKDEDLVDDGVEVDSPYSLKAITFEGTITRTSLALARIYEEGIQGLFDSDEVMAMSCSLGTFFVEFDEINVRLYESSFTIKIGVKLTGLGSFTYFYPAYDISGLVEETNDWGL